MTNPLLKDSILPAFSDIEHQHVVSAVEKQIKEDKLFLASLLSEQTQPSWDNLIAPLAEQGDKLSKLFSPVSHMNSVVSEETFRQQHDACLPKLSDYYAELGQNQRLYKAYLTVAESTQLTERQRHIIEDELLGFRLAGVSLSEQDKKRFREIKGKLSELGSTFSNHVLDATMTWSRSIMDISELAGLPDSAIATAKQAAEQARDESKASADSTDETQAIRAYYLLTLDIPCYLAVITYADDAMLRQEIYRAYCTRASSGDLDNTSIISETLALRHEMALLLGFKSYAEYSLATKMADDAQQVVDFLQQLADLSIKKAHVELEELTLFAKTLDHLETLNPWDVAYYSEKLKQKKYHISEEELRPWFPEDQVLKGLFEITHRLYGVTFNERDDVDVWHSDVRFFEINDQKGVNIGSFYFDLYARKDKRGGAWMDSCRDRKLAADGKLQKPVAYLTCNFNAPLSSSTDIDSVPALFTHDEVVTLFHEFGHGLHHLMTEIDEIQVSGINGVAWDAVELPSQFMENFCYEKESLGLIARHHETGEPLSDAVLKRLNDARQFQAAMGMVRQLEFSLFDFKCHLEYPKPYQDILSSVREQICVMKPPEWNRFENSFSHIFAGGYAAGYYSYKWAEVLSADVWAYFEEQRSEQAGVFNPASGQRFLKQLLSQGGSKKAMDLFVNFRGREPIVEPLLAQQGIASA